MHFQLIKHFRLVPILMISFCYYQHNDIPDVQHPRIIKTLAQCHCFEMQPSDCDDERNDDQMQAILFLLGLEILRMSYSTLMSYSTVTLILEI